MKFDFGTVSERDMDMLFLNAFGSDKGFLHLFIDKTDLQGTDYDVKEVYLSKADKDGESDITVIIGDGNRKYGILIEDKIDAQAMPDQQKRYTIRGNKAVKRQEYDEYRDFIVCSQGYYDINAEAKKYSYFVSYEECADYFRKSDVALANAWVQQIEQAITKSKKHSETEINEGANLFYNRYKDYQEANYPQLDLRTDRGGNGWWAHYATRYKSVYLYHKIPQGYVDLTFPNAAIKMDGLSNIARTLNEVLEDRLQEQGLQKILAIPTGKAGALRVEVPKFDSATVRFDDVDISDISKCFFALSIFTEFANMLASADNVTGESR
ncbi:hypothetical protein SAMN02910292_02551 [Lachnospiraceae bacterium XBB2008]|nr:hypothetical protein SAMN02910292_02551 [Lachnospiraceae bacterium XBB2008]